MPPYRPQGQTAYEQFRASGSPIGYLGDINVFLAFDVETSRMHFGCRYNVKVLCVDLPRAALCACNAQAEDFFAYKEPTE